MQNLKQFISFIIIINSSILSSQDADLFISISDGDWDNPAVWNNSGIDTDGVPDQDDTVEISHNIICSASSISDIAKFTINNAASLTLDPSFRLRIWGSNEISTIDGSGIISGPGTINAILNHDIIGSGTISNVNFQTNNWILRLGVDATTNGISLVSSGGFKVYSGSTLTINGDVIKYNSSKALVNEGTIIINDPDFMSTNDPPSNGFRSDNGDVVYNVTGNFPVPKFNSIKNVTVNGDATSSGDLSITGDFINNGTFTCSNNDNITFNGSSLQTISGSGVSNFKNLTLNNSNGLDINAGTVNIEQVFDLQSGNVNATGSTVILESNSDNTAGQLDLGSSSYSGNLTVERFIPTSAQGYRMFGSPVQGTTLEDWQNNGIIFSGFPGSDFENFSWINSYTYDESSATDLNKEAGWVPSGNISNSTIPQTGTFIYTDASSYTLSVTGTPNQGSQPITVQSGGTTDQRGWNLITNPYPCNLDWDLFHADNSSVVDDAYWIYDGNVGNLVFYAGAGGGTLSNIISHSQGIWVHKTAVGTNSIAFEQTHLSTTATNYIKSTNGINNPLQIKISGDVNGYRDFSFIKAIPNATMNFDQGLDLYKFFSPIPDSAPNVYIETNDGYIVGAAFINNNQSIDIPIGVEIGSLAPGNYTLDFTEINQFMIGSCITLEDLENGIITDLRSDSSYTFSSFSSVLGPRFILHIAIDYDITVSNENCYISNDGEILLTGNNISGSYFQIFNNNILVDSLVAVNDSVNFVHLNAGIYTMNSNHSGTCVMDNQEIIITQPIEPVLASFEMNNDTVYLDQSNEVVFNNLSTGSLTYLWEFGDGNTSTDVNPIHNYTNQGVYAVVLYADNDNIGVCTDVTINNLIVFPTNPNSIDNLFDIESFNIYQYNSDIIIQYENESFDCCYLTDISGKRISNKISRVSGSNSMKIAIKGISSGIYFISFENEFGLIHTRKIYLN